MALELSKLQKARTLAGGIIQARCPACAEQDRDHAGDHLRVYPDGRFGCCVHPGSREHRRRIFALAGCQAPRRAVVSAGPVAPVRIVSHSIRASLVEMANRRRPEAFTASPETDSAAPNEAAVVNATSQAGTPGTPRANPAMPVAGSQTEGMPVPAPQRDGGRVGSNGPGARKLPYLAGDGTLVIPFDSPGRFHWWKGGQSVERTREEV